MYPEKHVERLLAEPDLIRLSPRDAVEPPEVPAANPSPAAMCATELG